MNASRTPSLLMTSLSLALCLTALLVSACSDPPDPGNVTNNNGDNNNDEVACETSADCDGGICLLEICRPCADDSVCASDDEYGEGATCEDGACVACDGDMGCPCEGDDDCSGVLTCRDEVCTECITGDEGCACFGNNTCAEGLRCNEEICEACPPGQEGCACAEGDVCDGELVCMEGSCVVFECELGELGCPCREEGEDDRCDEGLTCSESDMCAECSNDIVGCACDEEGNCENDLVCDEEDETCREVAVCADLGCVENQLCQDEEPGIDALCLSECADGFAFNEETGLCDTIPQANCRANDGDSILAMCGLLNRQCIEADESAECGACLTDFTDEGGNLETCRALVQCDALSCADDNRECTPHSPDTDAECAGCLMGFQEENEACVPLPQANCQPDAELSILADCNNQNRLCVENENGAQCGICQEGFGEENAQCIRRLCADIDCEGLGRVCGGEPLAECGECNGDAIPTDPNDPLSQCRDRVTCLTLECPDGQFCVDREDLDATCSEWPCLGEDNEPDFESAYRVDTDECVFCGIRCEIDGAPRVEGETGQIWPFTLDRSNRCICETEVGFYVDPGGNFTARPCDGDGDGWVRSSAKDLIDSDDVSLSTNARCDLKKVDRFELSNEYGQDFTVHSCLEGFVGSFACAQDDDCEVGRCNLNEGVCDCIVRNNLDLYESVRNDDQDELDDAGENDVPAYTNLDDRGRRLRASELTPLTKGCVSVTADLNDNGVRDVVEYQGDEPEGADAATIAFMRFGYFTEIFDGTYEDVIGEDVGFYRISSKSRCGDFPLQYDTNIDGPYWRDCTRNRDRTFNRAGEDPRIGYDFAEWTCSESFDTCDFPPPPTDQTPDGEIPPHGLCEQGVTLPPVDGIWRGMNHHSQFKCVQIAEVLPENRDTVAPHIRLASELTDANGSGGLQMNTCSPACPVGFDEPLQIRDFSNIGDMTLNGDAVQDGGDLQLTPNEQNQVGTAFLTAPFDTSVSASFSTRFELSMGPNPAGGTGAIFIVQNTEDGAEAIGNDAFRLGYESMPSSIGVEFDTTDNGDGDNEPNANHVAVSVNGNLFNPIAIAIPDFDLNFGVNHVWITFEDEIDTLSVFVSQTPERPEDPLLAVIVDVGLSVGDQAFFGFGAGNGGSRNRHAIQSWGLQVGPELDNDDPTCAEDCGQGEVDCVVSSEFREGLNNLPRYECAPIPRSESFIDQVGFVAVRYNNDPGNYTRGCIDEFQPDVALSQSEPWKDLCPGYSVNPDGVVGQGTPGNFGRLICGCGFNYGGPNCDVGCAGDTQCEGDDCAGANLFYGGDGVGDTCDNGYCPVVPDGEGGGRRGFWMCGSWSSMITEGDLIHEDGWRLDGEVPKDGIGRDTMCENEDCGTGFNLR